MHVRAQTAVCLEKFKVLHEAGTKCIETSIFPAFAELVRMALRAPNLCLFSSSLSPSSLLMMGVLPCQLVYRMKDAIGTGEKNTDSQVLEVWEVQEEIVGLRVGSSDAGTEVQESKRVGKALKASLPCSLNNNWNYS